MAVGFFVIWRSLMDSPVWLQADAVQQSILINLLSRVAWKGTKWDVNGNVVTLKAGQLYTSIAEIVRFCPKEVTTRKVRTALNRFIKFGFLTIETTKGGAHGGTLITVVNWDKYQNIKMEAKKDVANETPIQRQDSDKTATNERQVSDKAIKEQGNKVTRKQGNILSCASPGEAREKKRQSICLSRNPLSRRCRRTSMKKDIASQRKLSWLFTKAKDG